MDLVRARQPRYKSCRPDVSFCFFFVGEKNIWTITIAWFSCSKRNRETTLLGLHGLLCYVENSSRIDRSDCGVNIRTNLHAWQSFFGANIVMCEQSGQRLQISGHCDVCACLQLHAVLPASLLCMCQKDKPKLPLSKQLVTTMCDVGTAAPATKLIHAIAIAEGDI